MWQPVWEGSLRENGYIALQVDSLPDEPQEKPKNTGVGSHTYEYWSG